MLLNTPPNYIPHEDYNIYNRVKIYRKLLFSYTRSCHSCHIISFPHDWKLLFVTLQLYFVICFTNSILGSDIAQKLTRIILCQLCTCCNKNKQHSNDRCKMFKLQFVIIIECKFRPNIKIAIGLFGQNIEKI